MNIIMLNLPLFSYHTYVLISAHAYICSTRLGNLTGYVTGFRLRNGITGYATGCPDGIPESSPVRLLNRLTTPIVTQLYNWVTTKCYRPCSVCATTWVTIKLRKVEFSTIFDQKLNITKISYSVAT